jgi:uncharacterized protein YlaI
MEKICKHCGKYYAIMDTQGMYQYQRIKTKVIAAWICNECLDRLFVEAMT